eukprot:357869-Chlamydomonas_euryale.AAC.1
MASLRTAPTCRLLRQCRTAGQQQLAGRRHEARRFTAARPPQGGPGPSHSLFPDSTVATQAPPQASRSALPPRSLFPHSLTIPSLQRRHLQRLLELAALRSLQHDVGATKELAVDIDLREGRPLHTGRNRGEGACLRKGRGGGEVGRGRRGAMDEACRVQTFAIQGAKSNEAHTRVDGSERGSRKLHTRRTDTDEKRQRSALRALLSCAHSAVDRACSPADAPDALMDRP